MEILLFDTTSKLFSKGVLPHMYKKKRKKPKCPNALKTYMEHQSHDDDDLSPVAVAAVLLAEDKKKAMMRVKAIRMRGQMGTV